MNLFFLPESCIDAAKHAKIGPMKKSTHFLGMGGIGMSALAHILLEKGEPVSGMDQGQSPILNKLLKKGAILGEDFDADTCVVYSSAIPPNHPAYQKAQAQGCSLVHRSEFLGKLMEEKTSLLVTGTHGKTSTAALLTWVLMHADLAPSYAVGGILQNTEQNGGYGAGPYFVAEADESDGSFLNYTGVAGIVTNLEKEHLDYWKTEDALCTGFSTFCKGLDPLFWCGDDPLLASLGLQGESYGMSARADWRLIDVHQDGMTLSFTIQHEGRSFENVRLPLVGTHQALNAVSVWALAQHLGISEEKIRTAFETFKGVQRRLEKKGEAQGIVFYDDYAHHPTEIKALLKVLKRAVGTRRLVAIFQPHRYTRTRDLMRDFSPAFDAADCVYILDVYPAGEEPIAGISGEVLARTIPNSHFMQKDALPPLLEGDVVVTLGAGDVTHLGPKLMEALK